MNRTNKSQWIGTVESHGDAVALLKQAGDCVMVERGYPRNLLFKCPDGCGEIITINLDPASGPSWKLYKNNGQYTLYPSVALTAGCKSHFILLRNKFIWCDYSRNKDVIIDNRLLLLLKQSLKPSAIHYSALAEKLNELPWDVLWACNELVRQGFAKETKRGLFLLVEPSKKTDSEKKKKTNNPIKKLLDRLRDINSL